MDSTTTTTAGATSGSAATAMPAITRTPEDRARLLAEWTASGLSAAEFAPCAGVTAHTLYAWRRRARAGDDAGGGRDERSHGGRRRRADADGGRLRGPFAEIVVLDRGRARAGAAATAGTIDSDGTATAIDIVLADVVVRTTRDFDATHLRRVLELVRATA